MSVLKDISQATYAEDVAAIMAVTTERFGMEEWRKIVLTNEIHGHLGIYSTIGAKMGLFALSLLGNEEEPEIVSFAGLTPPVSCFNDGLQVSTGATLGHGLIRISDEEEKRVEATFASCGKMFRLRLKRVYEERIREDICKGVAMFGHRPEYWDYVRQLALNYWRDWDRNEIFEIIPS